MIIKSSNFHEDQNLKAIQMGDTDEGAWFCVGQFHVTRITVVFERGPNDFMPWAEIYEGDKIMAKCNLRKASHVYFL